MQARAPLDDEMQGLAGYGAWRRTGSTSRRIITARLIAEAVGAVSLLALLCWVIALSVQLRSLQDSNSKIAPECIHALGGGPVGAGGSLHPVTLEYCKGQLRAYAQGPYWQEVALAAQDAMEVFGFAKPVGHSGGRSSRSRSGTWALLPSALLQRVPRSLLGIAAGAAGPGISSRGAGSAAARSTLGGPRHCDAADAAAGDAGQPTAAVVVSPAAAMAAGRGTAGQQQQQGQKPLVVFDIDETLLSNMPQILDPETWPWEQWVAAAQAAPLEPMLAFYQALCSNGYSIALVTGRREASRNSTQANLARAGYGTPCSNNNSSGSRSSSSSGGGGKAGCCYDALMMRLANDTRLASLYKPWARAQLLAGGAYRLFALLGDQFSDINGQGVEAGSGVQAYKLPNPFYFIL